MIKAFILTVVLSMQLIFASGRPIIGNVIFPMNTESSFVSFTDNNKDKEAVIEKATSLYELLNLSELGLSKSAYEYAIQGYVTLLSNGKLNNSNVLSIVDFSHPSSKKRLYVIDLKNGKLLFNTYVAHGRGSGREMASDFSNAPESNKSSLGFFVTGDTYFGKHGLSLRLFGEEKGINDNANSRAIVMHSASYVTEDIIKTQGFIGRSQGCPALPEALSKPIIDKVKNGSCLFLYSPDKFYLTNSRILKNVIKEEKPVAINIFKGKYFSSFFMSLLALINHI